MKSGHSYRWKGRMSRLLRLLSSAYEGRRRKTTDGWQNESSSYLTPATCLCTIPDGSGGVSCLNTVLSRAAKACRSLGSAMTSPSQELLGPLIGSAELVQKPVHVLDVGRHQCLLWRDVGHGSSPCLWVEELKNGHFNWRTGRMPPLAFCESERVISRPCRGASRPRGPGSERATSRRRQRR